MKRILLCASTLILVSFFNLSAQSLITNNDFEAGDKSGWSGFNNGVTIAANETTIDFSYNGAYSGKINNGEGSLFQLIGVTPGNTYSFSFYAKFRDADDVTNVVVKDELTGGKPVVNSVAVNSDSWTNYTFDFVAPSTGKVRVLFYKGNGVGPLYIDDVVLQEATTTGIQENITLQIAMYPNPLRQGEALTIQFKDDVSAPVEVIIYGINGQVVYQTTTDGAGIINIDRELDKGIYFVKLQAGEKTSFNKLVVN